jgi:hypothetical protein
MARDISIMKSKIEGKGIFACRDFKKGEIVLKRDISHQLSSEEVKKIPETEKRYIAYFKKKLILMQSPAKYVNHSCDSNTYVDNFCDVAKRHIKTGDEITADYSETMRPGEFMKCNCGSKNCRAIIKAEN